MPLSVLAIDRGATSSTDDDSGAEIPVRQTTDDKRLPNMAEIQAEFLQFDRCERPDSVPCIAESICVSAIVAGRNRMDMIQKMRDEVLASTKRIPKQIKKRR